MSRRTSSNGDQGKAPMYNTSHRDNSSDEETASVGEQVARVLQSHFDCRGDNPKPTNSILNKTWSKRQRSVYHSASLQKGRGPPEERCELRTSL